MRILVTGADGFIGKNLLLHIREMEKVECVCYTRSSNLEDLSALLVDIDWIFHLAGANRPKQAAEFITDNFELTVKLCEAIRATKRRIPVVFASSIQSELNNEYGKSKKLAEDALLALNNDTGNPLFIYRLCNVFGKFARPNYNSVVATFCYNITRGMPIKIEEPTKLISLIYIDDVIKSFMNLLVHNKKSLNCFVEVKPEYTITIGRLADQLMSFNASRETLITEPVGTGLIRALYSTFISYLPTESFSYALKKHDDDRGIFVEMLKTTDSGQFSFFTARPGITRGGHYHHSKTEKFFVIRGNAKFSFRNMVTGEFHELHVSGNSPQIVETPPGWTHDITNVGDQELICLLWANELFDKENPDTFTCPVKIER